MKNLDWQNLKFRKLEIDENIPEGEVCVATVTMTDEYGCWTEEEEWVAKISEDDDSDGALDKSGHFNDSFGEVEKAGLPVLLTFKALEKANIARIPQFRNKKGELAHKKDGSDWCLGQWMNAVAGEVGEAANEIKKIERGDFTLDERREFLGKEFADVAIYLSIVAWRAGIDLGEAIIEKFNEVSERVDSDVRLSHEGAYKVVTRKRFL